MELVEPFDGNPTTDGCADGIYTGSINAGNASLNFDVTVQGGKITNVGSRLTGITFGIEYEMGSWTSSGNKVTVTGTHSINLFFENIGRLYSYGTTHIITLPCNL